MATPPSGDGRWFTGEPVARPQQISAAVIERLEDALALVDSDSGEHVTVGVGKRPGAADSFPRSG